MSGSLKINCDILVKRPFRLPVQEPRPTVRRRARPMSTRPNAPDSFPEPLTARELEILRYMAEGAHFGEIAQRLHLSPTTVKWYSQQIYGKLGIDHAGQKRRLAVARARALGLLEPERTPTGRPRYSLPV